MYSLIFLILTSLFLALALTPLCKRLAWRLRIVDLPDAQRKLHGGPVPRLGGLAILASILGAYGLLLLARFSSGAIIWQDLPLVLRILPSMLVVFAVGLADDIHSLRPWVKFGIEAAAAALAWFGGIHVSGIEGHTLPVALGFLVTIVWIVSCTNAINLIDGLDGLAAGVSLFAAITMLMAALIEHNYPMALVTVPLVGALLGFLRYNFHPATIFLGDSGSLSLGFILACCAAVWSEKAMTTLGLSAPLIALAVPLLDTVLAVIRRFINNERIFGADRAHIHHKLLSQGLPAPYVALVIYAACAFATISSLLLASKQNRYHSAVVISVCLAGWFGLHRLGYKEFGVVRRAVLNGTFRNVLSAQLAVDTFESAMQREMTLEGCAEILCEIYPRFGFSGLALELDGVLQTRGAGSSWQAHIEFPGHGHITFLRAANAQRQNIATAQFIDCVSRLIDQKLEQVASTTPRTGTSDF